MKLAWICYEYDYEDERNRDPVPLIKFNEPERYRYHTVIPIVYAEVEKNDD